MVKQSLIPFGHPNRPGHKIEQIKAVALHFTQSDGRMGGAQGVLEFMSRPFAAGFYWCEEHTRFEFGILEKDSIGKTSVPDNLPEGSPQWQRIGLKFNLGSVHALADSTGIIECLPLDEVALAVGDRPLSWHPLFKGQKPLAMKLFSNKQNFETLSVAVCSPNEEDAVSWLASITNAKDYIVDRLIALNLRVDIKQSLHPVAFESLAPGEVLLLRHYDLTGKNCPEPLVKNLRAWEELVHEVGDRVNLKL